MRYQELIVNAQQGTVSRLLKSGARKEIGYKNGRYIRAQVDGESVYIHRLIYTHTHGPIPESFDVDHINGNGSDNRIENLRIATRSQNQENRLGAQKNSSTHVRGVYWHKAKKKYMASIKSGGRAFFLGYFDEKDDAELAYRKAATHIHTYNNSAFAG